MKSISPAVAAKNSFSDLIRASAYLNYRGMPAFGHAVGLSESTIRKRVKNPRTFSVAELNQVRRVLGLEKEDILKYLADMI